MRRAAVLISMLALAAPAAAQQGGSGRCIGELDEDAVPKQPASSSLRFGVTPGVQTGQLGTGPAQVVPEDVPRHLDSLARLRPPGGAPFVLRLHRFFWSDGEEGIRRFEELVERYTGRGYGVELQLRYHPSEAQEGDIAAWTRFVREVVRRFGPNRRVIAIQVTNEVNLTFSPDSSDGAYEGARDALIQGVIAAKDEARRRGFDQLEIGFNWAYRTDPESEESFWTYLRDHAGLDFLSALDWVGLDAYPGTFFPPANTPGGGERGAMVNAMSTLRCFLAYARIPDTVPMHVEENGWPTSPPTRTYERQAEVAASLVQAVHDYRGTYNVSDYRWFNLRDGDSSSPNFQVQYGLLRSDYVEKPAFEVYRMLVAELTRPAEPDPPRLALRLRCRRGRLVAAVAGADAGEIERAAFFVGRRRAGRDRRAPFRTTVPNRLLRRRGPTSVRTRVLLRDGREVLLRRRAGPCTRVRTLSG